jgi:esterase/lipase superfamily enzyme
MMNIMRPTTRFHSTVSALAGRTHFSTASGVLGKDYTLFVTNRSMNQQQTEGTVEFAKDNHFSSAMTYCEKRGNTIKKIAREDFAERILDSGKNVLFYIHGFRNTPKNALDKNFELQSLLDRDPNSAKINSVTVPVIWPCKVESFLHIDDEYHTDHDAAEHTVVSLASALHYIFDTKENEVPVAAVKDKARFEKIMNQRFNVLSHSMGNFVLNGILERLKENERFLNRVVFKHIFMAAAGIPNDSLDKKQDSAISEFSKTVSVYYAGDDLALVGSAFVNINESHFGLSKRLGQTGPSDPKALPENVYAFDCDSFNNTYDPPVGHSYYGKSPKNETGKLFSHIMRTIHEGKPPTEWKP